MSARLLQVRLWLEARGLFPRGKLAYVTLYLLALDVLLLVIERLAGLFRGSFADYLGGWVVFLTVVVSALGCVLGARWSSSRLLWRLRNRLIVTYIFIGVIPLILLTLLGGLAFYLFSGQFAAYILTSKLDSELRRINAGNLVITERFSADLSSDRTNSLKNSNLAGQRNWEVWAWLDGKPLMNIADGVTAPEFPSFVRDDLTSVVRDHDSLFLRSVATLSSARGKLTVVSSRPLDQRLLADWSRDLGEITLFRSDTGVENPTPVYSMGSIPSARRLLDVPVTFGATRPVIAWADGQATAPLRMSVQTRFSKLYELAFSSLGDLASSLEFVLFIVIIALIIFEGAAWYIGMRLTRSVTRAVGQLYNATTYINRGEFSHRIPVASRDQLAALAESFNLMTASIEKLILEQKEKQRLQNEITIAQEVQAQLFPRHITQLPSLEVHGFCRPARSVSGDYYDFLPLGSERLVLAVGDVSGKGISAALLMATIHSAVRAYSMEGIPALRQMQAVGAGPSLVTAYDPVIPGAEVSPGTLLSLLNHQLYHSTPAEKYATLFLTLYDGNERKLTFSNAGHLPPLLLDESGSVRKLEDGGTVVGLFDDMRYDEASVKLRSGEIFLAYSDGVTEPENDFGEFGEERLIELVHENRDLPLERIADIVTAAVDDWIGGAEQPDDVTLVLARAR
jgi:sigma-B regulation protein RsbU (phosphoserine phosphatase)